jgi:arylsulfatase A-like enzyme
LLASCSEARVLPNVVLVSMDTVRADALSCYGNPRDTTPGLDALAGEGVRFAEVWASSPNTAPSHATLFTGLAPFAHGVANHSSVEKGTPALAPELVTLAERFGEEGYETAAFTDDGPLGRAWNLLAGFDDRRVRYEDVSHKVRSVLRYLDEREGTAPLYLFVHSYQAHQPYLPPPEYEARFAGDYDGPLAGHVAKLRELSPREAQNSDRELMRARYTFTPADVAYLRALYDAEVAYLDAELAKLWHALRKGAWDDTIVCVTADHGEEFGEHGYFGHAQLYSETLRVPWILKLTEARNAGLVFSHPVVLLDLHTTLLDAAGLEPAAGVESRSLLPFLSVSVDPDRPRIAATLEHMLFPEGRAPYRRSARIRSRTLVSNYPIGGGEEQLELYDSEADPEELAPLDLELEPNRSKAVALRARIEASLEADAERRMAISGRAELFLERGSSETEAQMRALGYLEDR